MANPSEGGGVRVTLLLLDPNSPSNGRGYYAIVATASQSYWAAGSKNLFEEISGEININLV